MNCPLSVFIITHNEADRLPATLKAITSLTDDIVVVDSGSTDGTADVARTLRARVISHDWEGYGLQKRFAEEQCRHTWLLNIDADEVIPPDLLAEIATLFAMGEPSYDAYTLRIAEMFPSETKPHPWAYALKPIRLYRKDKGRYVTSPVHDRVLMEKGARVAALKGTVHHYSVRSIGDQMSKLNTYTDAQVSDLIARGKSPSLLRLWFEFPSAFFKAYVLRRHFVRGAYGFMTAMNFAFYRYLRMAKWVEKDRMKG
jgi:glycosyltransferase involved in cell wall biosynthesis